MNPIKPRPALTPAAEESLLGRTLLLAEQFLTQKDAIKAKLVEIESARADAVAAYNQANAAIDAHNKAVEEATRTAADRLAALDSKEASLNSREASVAAKEAAFAKKTEKWTGKCAEIEKVQSDKDDRLTALTADLEARSKDVLKREVAAAAREQAIERKEAELVKAEAAAAAAKTEYEAKVSQFRAIAG